MQRIIIGRKGSGPNALFSASLTNILTLLYRRER
jgi:hypothetical protein